MLIRLLLVAAMTVPLALTAQPAATVFTTAPVKINGVQVANAGVPSLPLAPGDEIATTTGSALIVFPDGSRVTISKEARAKVTEGLRGIDLLSGSAAYKSSSASPLAIHALGRPVDLKSLSEGMISITGAEKVTLRAKGPGDDEFLKDKYKKPKPRSNHGRGNDEP